MKPVVYVPGYPGSDIHVRTSGKKLYLTPGILLPSKRDEILRGLEPDPADDLSQPDPLVAGEPIRRFANLLFFDLAKQANSLYEILDRLGSPVWRFGWDWRRPVFDSVTQQGLRQAVERHSADRGAPVVLIAHSTGGLVVRRFLEENANDAALLSQIECVIAFGVPWAGALKSFQFLMGAENFGPISKQAAQRLVTLTWAAYDLLPPDPARTDLTGVTGEPLNLVVNEQGTQIGPLSTGERGWFQPTLATRMSRRADAADRELGARTPTLDPAGRGLPIFNVVGFGAQTAVRATAGRTHQTTKIAFKKDKEDATLDGGDGTVPRVSAAWLRGANVRTFHVPVGMDHLVRNSPHSVLWRNPGGQNVLRNVLTGAPLEPFVYAAIDDEDFYSGKSVRVRCAALDERGAPLPGATARAVELSGGDGPETSFDPARSGRHMIRVARERIPKVQRQSNDGYRRLVVEIGWTGAGQPIRRALALRV